MYIEQSWAIVFEQRQLQRKSAELLLAQSAKQAICRQLVVLI